MDYSVVDKFDGFWQGELPGITPIEKVLSQDS
jgi:hypothetical protein